MKTFPAGLDLLLITGKYVYAELYDFTLWDGSHVRYTTADTDVIFSTNRYTSKGPFFDTINSKSTAHWKAGLDLDTWVVQVCPAQVNPITGVAPTNPGATLFGQPWLAAVAGGALRGATVDVHRLYIATSWPQPWASPLNADVLPTLPTPSGATHLWPMTNATVSGTAISDVVGGDNGTAGSSVASTTGPTNLITTARDFTANNTQSFISLASSPFTDLTSNYSIGFWLNIPDVTVANSGGGAATFSREFVLLDTLNSYRLQCALINVSGTVGQPYTDVRFDTFQTDDNTLVASGATVATSTNFLASNVWNYIVLTHASGSNTGIVYINGVAVATVAGSSAAPSSATNALGTRMNAGLADRQGVGQMANVTIYPRVLSATDVTILYAAQSLGAQSMFVLQDLFAGRVADIDITRTEATITINSWVEILTRPMPRNVYQAPCRWTLFDAGCGIADTSFKFNGTVTNAHGGNLTLGFDSGLTQADGYFSLGRVLWTSGNNIGFPAGVRNYSNANGNFLLLRPPPFPIQVGDTFTAYAGCDKTLNTCNVKFANTANFGGFPFIPIAEHAI